MDPEAMGLELTASPETSTGSFACKVAGASLALHGDENFVSLAVGFYSGSFRHHCGDVAGFSSICMFGNDDAYLALIGGFL